MAKKSSMKNRRSNLKLKGGAGSAEHAIATYGGMGSQVAAPSVVPGVENNVIAMHSGEPSQPPVAAISGGRKKKGGNLTDIAVPAVLLVANHLYKRRGAPTLRYKGSRRSRRNFSRKVRGGSVLSPAKY